MHAPYCKTNGTHWDCAPQCTYARAACIASLEAEVASLRAKLEAAEQERDRWMREFTACRDDGVECIVKLIEERGAAQAEVARLREQVAELTEKARAAAKGWATCIEERDKSEALVMQFREAILKSSGAEAIAICECEACALFRATAPLQPEREEGGT